MCGRYGRTTAAAVFAEMIGARVSERLDDRPGYNIAPGLFHPIGLRSPKDRSLAIGPAWWGFTPSWASDTKIQPVNARSETAHEKPMFRKAFQNQRCVIPLDWWIEWYRTDSGKQPYAIRPTDVATERREKAPFFLAGLWNKAPEIEGFEGSGKVTYTILTQKPHPDIAGVHDRQPVALTVDDVNAWLDEEVGNDELRDLIERRGFETYDFWAISKRIGSVAHQDSSLIDPISQ